MLCFLFFSHGSFDETCLQPVAIRKFYLKKETSYLKTHSPGLLWTHLKSIIGKRWALFLPIIRCPLPPNPPKTVGRPREVRDRHAAQPAERFHDKVAHGCSVRWLRDTRTNTLKCADLWHYPHVSFLFFLFHRLYTIKSEIKSRPNYCTTERALVWCALLMNTHYLHIRGGENPIWHSALNGVQPQCQLNTTR